MKIQILQLESHDDITSARDKMTWANAPRILLAWPHTRRLFGRKIDLVLLQRHAKSLGAQLGLVTRQADVRTHAAELGIPVFRSIQQARRKAWGIPIQPNEPQETRVYRGNLRQAKPSKTPVPQFFQFKAVQLLIFSIAIAALLSLAAFLLPSARIEIAMPAETQDLDLEISVRPAGAASMVGSIPYTVEHVTISREAKAPTTGWIDIPGDPARGSVDFTNLTDEVVTIPTGTIIMTGQKARYQTTEAVDLPARTGITTRSQVQAIEGGMQGNTAANTANIIEGDLRFKLAVTNPQPITGGTDQREMAPTEEDISALEEQLLEQMASSAGEQISAKLGEERVLINRSTVLKRVITRKVTPDVGNPGAAVSITLEVEFSGAAYSKVDLSNTIGTLLDAGLPSNMTSVPGSLTLELADAPAADPTKSGVYTLRVKASRQITGLVESNQVAMAAAGQSHEAAISALRSAFPQAERFTIRSIPAWWPIIPFVPFRIQIEQTGQPSISGAVG